MPLRCVSGFCSHTHKDGVSLFRFPKGNHEKDVLKKWIAFVRLTRKDWKGTSKRSVLCSAHFTEECFEHTPQLKASLGINVRCPRKLKPGAIPTLTNHPPTKFWTQEMDKETNSLPQPKKSRGAFAKRKRKRDHYDDADMNDPLKMNATAVKEEMTFKEEMLEESEVLICPSSFSAPAGKMGAKQRKSSKKTATAEGETPTYCSEENWVVHHAGQKSKSQENIDQKTFSFDPKKDESPTKRLRSLEEFSDREERCYKGGASNLLVCGLPESEEEIILKKDIQLKKQEIKMRKKVLEMVLNVEPGDKSAYKEGSDSAVIELLKSDLHTAVEELELLLQEWTFLCNSKGIIIRNSN